MGLFRQPLRELAAREGKSMQAVLEKSIEHYRRQRFLEEVNTAYAALRQDREAWEAVEQERAQWDTTIFDGLELEEEWTEYGEAIIRNNQEESS